MLKVHFNRKLLTQRDSWVVFLNPILGECKGHIRGHDEKQIQERSIKGRTLIQESSLEECDFVVFPLFFKMDDFDTLQKASDEAMCYNKKVIVFYVSDIDTEIKIKNLIVFRTSITQKNPKNEYCMPPFPGDTLEKYCNGEMKLTKLSGKISLGYAGYSGYYNFKTFLLYIFLQITRKIMNIGYIKRWIYNSHREKIYHLLSTIGIGKFIRSTVIRQLKNTKKIEFNFIERKGGLYLDAPEKTKKEYINNIVENNFALVIRGNGNYSFRLYEVMSLGKIPVFIDTECRLPFEEKIEYKKLFVRVPYKEINNIDKYLYHFVKKNGGKINELQEKIRAIYKEYFTTANYYTKIISSLMKNRNLSFRENNEKK